MLSFIYVADAACYAYDLLTSLANRPAPPPAPMTQSPAQEEETVQLFPRPPPPYIHPAVRLQQKHFHELNSALQQFRELPVDCVVDDLLDCANILPLADQSIVRHDRAFSTVAYYRRKLLIRGLEVQRDYAHALRLLHGVASHLTQHAVDIESSDRLLLLQSISNLLDAIIDRAGTNAYVLSHALKLKQLLESESCWNKPQQPLN